MIEHWRCHAWPVLSVKHSVLARGDSLDGVREKRQACLELQQSVKRTMQEKEIRGNGKGGGIGR